MSFRSVRVIPESCQLQHLHHVLHVGMQATAANTRSNRPVRVSTDFELVPQKSMGHTPLELSRFLLNMQLAFQDSSDGRLSTPPSLALLKRASG